jgi:hypothetical protein
MPAARVGNHPIARGHAGITLMIPDSTALRTRVTQDDRTSHTTAVPVPEIHVGQWGGTLNHGAIGPPR